LAQNALKKIKTLKIPDLLLYSDSTATDTDISIATEEVTPLIDTMEELRNFPQYAVWGIYQIAVQSLY
jgi:hypothetical protein